MKFLLKEMGDGPALLTGDLNTNTFERGTALKTFVSALRLLGPDVREAVMFPWRYEPLFEEMKQAGFSWEGFNDDLATCYADLAALEDKKYLPPPLRNYILRRIHGLPLKLDWIAGRGVRPVSPGRTITDLPAQPSDHLPIVCDVEMT